MSAPYRCICKGGYDDQCQVHGIPASARKLQEQDDAKAIADARNAVDILATNHVRIWVLYGLTDAGREWLEAKLDPEAPRWGQGWVVEPRYASDILQGAQDDGLVVK